MDIAELKNADGQIEVALGDLVQAMVVSTSGGLTDLPDVLYQCE
jgi:hypothetical protein